MVLINWSECSVKFSGYKAEVQLLHSSSRNNYFVPLSGKYPVETVKMMHKICCEAEAAMFHRVVFDELRLLTPKPTETLKTTSIAAVDAAFSQSAAAIICLTTTGR